MMDGRTDGQTPFNGIILDVLDYMIVGPGFYVDSLYLLCVVSLLLHFCLHTE